jgi:hypothetical protein
LDERVRELAGKLGRSITTDGWIVVQKCAICEVELRLHYSILEDDFTDLAQQLFRFYDQHRCRAEPTELTFQRAERAFVQLGESALALDARGDDQLARRADLESQRLVEWVERFRRRSA